ncbi:MAG: quinolinate synthase NadA [Bacteroidaceae bacterium]|nr:quinolinate synthase NadA [Bacteroidaceae bacterium]
MPVKDTWKALGYIDEPVPEGIDLKAEIRRLCKKKNAVVLAHYYTIADLQDIADFVGDSLALAQKAAATDADIIVMCGVHFMAETDKILCPAKKVLIPDLNASCSLAESCPADAFAEFVAAHPGHKVISYVNTSAAVKAHTDVVVTSGNAREIVESFPKDQPLIFGPDKNLGNYINSLTGREMLLWDGACHVHERFSVEKLVALKREHPGAQVLVHPECRGAVVKLADVVGSTARLLRHAQESDCREFLVVTESGILHQMQRACPDKTFIPVPPEDAVDEAATEGSSAPAACACNECRYMRLCTLEKVYNTLRYEWPEVDVDPAVAARALRPIERMLDISRQLGL